MALLPVTFKRKGKGKEAYLYSAFYILCISQSAQAWITQFYLQTHHALKVTILLFGTVLCHIPREIQHVLFAVCLQMNQNAHVACNFNYLFESWT